MSELPPKIDLQPLQALAQQCASRPLEVLDSRRLFHGRGQCYPGLEFVCIDFFQPALLVTLFDAPPQHWLDELLSGITPLALSANWTLVVQRRYLEGAPSEVVLGEMPERWFAARGPLRFLLNPLTQQNVGYFLDMEPGRRWLEANAAGKRVLNLFAYTCAFSVVAVAAGAAQVVNVDMSKTALSRGRENHQLNGHDKQRSAFLPEQILKSWSRIRRQGPYDIVILDPPSFQRGSFVASKDYAKLVRRLPELLPQGGRVLACLNAPELATDFLHQCFTEYCPNARFVRRLANAPEFPDANPEQCLKLLEFEVAPATDPAGSA
ncbi:class I SAM-dependent methyltransferase [Gilvimarinus agarilyticus]|uniref:class I SAM-dependent methyltransferase n=1 Tax=Gilvimarinus agarilyticus TaxID=679259 RepID=UPI0006976442|nr:class I SAM-dependent methyltransferase [Gilvimarinus agarilyticus]